MASLRLLAVPELSHEYPVSTRFLDPIRDGLSGHSLGGRTLGRKTQLDGSMPYSAPGDQSSEQRSPVRGAHHRNRNRERLAVGSGIRRPGGPSRRDILNYLAIHRPGDRGKRSVRSSLCMHSLEDWGNRAVPSSLGIHRPGRVCSQRIQCHHRDDLVYRVLAEKLTIIEPWNQ
jgi:hypothetical protein